MRIKRLSISSYFGLIFQTISDSDSLIRSLTEFQLRLFRNLIYARAGYAFKDETLTNAFLKYTWYIPDPAIKPEQAAEYYIPKEIMKKIVEEEGRRKESGVSR